MKRIYWTDLLVGENSLIDFIEQSNYGKYGYVISRIVIQSLKLEEIIFDKLMKNKNYQILLEIETETEKKAVETAIEPTKVYQPDVIIAIGGGSVIDAAKQLWLFLEKPHLTFNDYEKYYQLGKFSGNCDLVAVPTTSGTGSEMTGCAMFYDDSGLKKMFLDHNLLPTISILDRSLVRYLPIKPLIYSAFDALTHALEAVTNIGSDPISQFVGIQAFVTVVNNIEQAYQGDVLAREKLLVAASFAGVAINNANVGMSHTLNYPGEDFKLPHGLITGMITPYWVYYSNENLVYEELLKQLNQELIAPSNIQLAQYLINVFKRVSMPTCLKELNIEKEKYDLLVNNYIVRYFEHDSVYSSSPFQPDRTILKQLFCNLYSGDIFRK